MDGIEMEVVSKEEVVEFTEKIGDVTLCVMHKRVKYMPSSCIVTMNASTVMVLFPPNPLSGKFTKVKE